MKKRWLITGGGGQLGREFASSLDGVAEFYSFNSADLDITNFTKLESLIESVKPTHILNCAAWTNVEGAEKSSTGAFAVNVDGVRNLSSLTQKMGIHLTHFSTDYVFDGKSNTPYKTDDLKNPLSVYGLSKSLGEDAINDTNSEGTLIIRTSWLYGAYGSNFVKTILRLEKEREKISIVSDQVGQPTSASELANFVIEVLNQGYLVGTYHACNSGSASWYDFAQMIFDKYGKDSSRILPIKTSEYPQAATRPSYSVLSLDKWNETNISPMQSWQSALSNFIELDGTEKRYMGES
jgi:dTDP-4-dehydrorhamnose reductase